MTLTHRQAIHQALIRLSNGEREAFPAMKELLWPMILAFTRRTLGTEMGAEDIAQNVFLRICSRISDFDHARDGVSWAFGIASYEIKTHRRRIQRRRETSYYSLDLHVDPTESADELLCNREMIAAMEQLVGELSADDRYALGLEAPTHGRTIGGATLRKRRQRALERLRQAWRNLYGDP